MSLRKWLPFAWVADDGEFLALSRGGLVPRYEAGFPVVSFIHRGRITGYISLRDVATPQDVEKTVSNLRWGEIVGFAADGRFVVRTLKGERLYFTPPP
jgi:hypothetical protein